MVWNMWGFIVGFVEDVFGWSDGMIVFFENWGLIVYIVFFVFFLWFLDVKGV